eukprot:125677_1
MSTLIKTLFGLILINCVQSVFRDTCPSDHVSVGCNAQNVCAECAEGCQYCQSVNIKNDVVNGICPEGTCVVCMEGLSLYDGYCKSVSNTDKSTLTPKTTVSRSSAPCEWTSSGLFSNTGKSFEFHRVCESRGIKTTLGIYLASINDETTEYTTGVWDQECAVAFTEGEATCTFSEFGKVKALENTLRANDDKLQWENILFLDSGTVMVNDKSVSVDRGDIKFGLTTNNWIYSNTLTVCLGLEASSYYGGVQLTDEQQKRLKRATISGRKLQIGEYLFDNELTAQCLGYDDISVDVTAASIKDTSNFGYDKSMSGAYTVFFEGCYKFEYCASGNIVYDPFVYYEGEEESNNSISMYDAFNFMYILSACVVTTLFFH